MGLFGKKPPSLATLSSTEQAKLDKALGQPGQASFGSPADASAFAVQRLRAAIAREPNEFVFHYMLVDHLHRGGLLTEAVRSAGTACRVAPKDPRATYALGTVLRTLARAKYDLPDFSDQVSNERRRFALMGQTYDPRASSLALAELGYDLPRVVRQVIFCFVQTLEHGVRDEEQAWVIDSMKAVRDEFPEYLT